MSLHTHYFVLPSPNILYGSGLNTKLWRNGFIWVYGKRKFITENWACNYNWFHHVKHCEGWQDAEQLRIQWTSFFFVKLILDLIEVRCRELYICFLSNSIGKVVTIWHGNSYLGYQGRFRWPRGVYGFQFGEALQGLTLCQCSPQLRWQWLLFSLVHSARKPAPVVASTLHPNGKKVALSGEC